MKILAMIQSKKVTSAIFVELLLLLLLVEFHFDFYFQLGKNSEIR